MPGSTDAPSGGVRILPSRTTKDVLARAFADVTVGVQRDAFGVAVGDGLHPDELRVHVIRAGLGQRGQRIGRHAGPTRDADVHALASASSPRYLPHAQQAM